MLPGYTPDGLLPPGVHEAEWHEVVNRFGYNDRRRFLLSGLKSALLNLKNAGCRAAYIDGSFVTSKEHPGDFDACWEEAYVDGSALDPVLLDFDNERLAQKLKYHGELLPASSPADPSGMSYLDFFQTTKEGIRKGIVGIDLEELT